METLYAYALLHAAGLAPEELYLEPLHTLFLSCPDDPLLLSLECETDPWDAAYHLQRYFTRHPLNPNRFGRALMTALRPIYRAAPDLKDFTDRLYILWTCLPAPLDREPPFWALSYAGEPLSWGDEAQARQLCETMLRHYDPS